MSEIVSIGDHLREWRRRRRVSQLELALEAEVSQRHLSFIESGRARPSRDMVLRLADRLDIPLRARNPLLLAAGFAPAYGDGAFEPGKASIAMAAIETVLHVHEPNPALAVDGHWHMVAANRAVAPLLADIADKDLLIGPVNVLRLSLSPGGLAPQILNFAEWRHHLLERLRRQAEASVDTVLIDMLRELQALPLPFGKVDRPGNTATEGLFVPLRLRSRAGDLSLISMTTVFGAPLDIAASEIALETFLPANPASAEALRLLCGKETA